MSVRFPDSPHAYSDGMVVHFTAILGKYAIKCAISLDALGAHFVKNQMSPLEAFSHHRASIERIAERLIFQKRFENNGSILIRRSDC